jgi:hypothetical protein
MTDAAQGKSIPGFTDDQTWALKQVVKDGVAEGIAEAFKDPRCPRACERVDAIESVVFGRAEKKVVGMDERLRSVERSLGYAARALWIAIGSLIVAVVGVIVGR